MTTRAELAGVMQERMTRLADEEGRQSGFIQRERKLKGSPYAPTLVFGWLSSANGTLSELTQAAARVGVDISKQGLQERFNERSAAFMERLLRRAVEYRVAADRVAVGVMGNFTAVNIQASTSISLPEGLREQWPGCNGQGTSSAALKVRVSWELVRGSLCGLQLQAAKYHDQRAPLAQQHVPTGCLQLRALGYFNMTHFARQAETDSYFLSRLKACTKLYTLDGCLLGTLDQVLRHAETDIDQEILLGAQRLRGRLLAWRVPEETADQRRARLQDQALDHARPVSPIRWLTAAWSVYITNVPPALLSLAQAQVLAKVRWQIELLFKRWNSQLALDSWRTDNPWRALTECLAKLLAALIQHWCFLLGLWFLPERSLHQAAQVIRKHALHLAACLHQFDLLCRALSIILRAVRTCKMSSLRKRPHTFQLLHRGALCLS